jgi:hypothetical protein
VVANVCGFAPDTQIVALVYLGWPTSAVEVPSRPPAEITVVAS